MRKLILIALCVCLAGVIGPETRAQGVPVRDAQALQIATLSISVMGGSNLVFLQDTLAEGTITLVRPDEQSTGTFALKTRGAGQLRGDFIIAGQASSAIYNAGLGASRLPDWSVKAIRPSQALAKRPEHLPVLVLSTDVNDPRAGVSLVGSEVVGGTSVWQLRFSRWIPPDTPLQEIYSKLAQYDVLIDQSTGLVVSLRYDVPSMESLLDRFPMEFRYEDYRWAGGLIVPYKITQVLAGRIIAIYEVTSFRTNAGASDLEFALPR